MKYNVLDDNSTNLDYPIKKKQNSSNGNLCLIITVITLIITFLVFIINILIDYEFFIVYGNFLVKSDTNIKKPNSDHRKYRHLILKNGLEAIIISDILATSSGASLAVSVGADSDPHTLQGLAHFLEHMLFLGSGKYPNGDDYFKTITENNGHFNAYTDREITNYFFDIHYYSFEKALDIFSRFFIDPLFNEDKLNKEVNSVNSEFEKNLIIDGRKRSQILSYISDPDNPFHRFTTGNLQTLIKNSEFYGLNLREELIKFHAKYYKADKMKLIIYSNDDLDDLEDIIISKFSDIKPSPEYLNSKTSNNKKLKQVTAKSVKQHSPFSKEILGSFIRFNSLNMEHEMIITFIQNPLINNYYSNNPSYYFGYLIESKDENSLIDILKKKQLATKLSTNIERDLKDWSDFTLQINLTQDGVNKLDEVLQIVHNYLNYMRANLLNKKTYDYLTKVAKLNFEYKTLHNQNIFELVNKIAAKSLNSPISNILDDIHLINNYNQTTLHNYANGLKLENSIIIIPSKLTENITYNFLFDNKQFGYEPWYRTNYSISKINFTVLNNNNSNKTFSHPEFTEIKNIDYLLNNTFNCNTKCIDELKPYKTDEPSLINRTSSYEYWYKHDLTLDFNRSSVEIEFNFDKFNNTDEKVNILLLESLIKRKLKKINSKLSFFSNSIKVSINHFGIKISYSTFNVNIISITHQMIEKIKSIYKNKEYNGIYQEVKEHLTKEYNAQPYQLCYDYMKEAIFKDYITAESYLASLEKHTSNDFNNFIENFKNNYYLKILILGDLTQKQSDEIFTQINPILRENNPSKIKNIVFDIGQKRKNKRKPIKLSESNYLVKKVYHQKTNKNNALLKCYKVGKTDYKNELLIHLFHNIIGNIVFRELRINKQFGYVAKSKIEIIDVFYFYCLHVQGSSKPPHIMDEAAIELINNLGIMFEKITNNEFILAKKKNMDTIALSRLDINKLSDKYFRKIVDNNYNFHNFFKMEMFSKSITKDDFISFYNDVFTSKENLHLTVYMHSHNNDKKDMEMVYDKENSYYQEIKN